MRDTLLFDLDGTLLPFWQDDFIASYFSRLTRELASLGFAPQAAQKAVYEGCFAMIRNDGRRSNREAFFAVFAERLGADVYAAEPALRDFYARGDFCKVREALREERDCAPLLVDLRQRGYTPVLATNPLFPPEAVRTRLSWINLSMEDFSFVTCYDNSRFCKPNLSYYRALLSEIGKTPQDCVMIGNSIPEDMCASQLGLEVFLVWDYLENPDNEDPCAWPGGDYRALCAYLGALPALA